MKILLRKLLQSKDAMAELAQQRNVPAQTSFFAARILSAAQTELMAFEQTRIKALDSAGATLNEAIGEFEFPVAGTKEQFAADIEELLNTEISLPGEPIALSKFGSATLSIGAMAVLDWLIVE